MLILVRKLTTYSKVPAQGSIAHLIKLRTHGPLHFDIGLRMQAAWVCRTPVSFAAKSTSNSVSLHRCLHATRTANSGHNRWSKIKHDKGKADAKTNADRSRFAQEIVTSVKCMYY